MSSVYFDPDEVLTYSGTRYNLEILGALDMNVGAGRKFFALLDLPLSFVYDTFFLPADVLADWMYNRTSSDDQPGDESEAGDSH